MPVSRGLTDRPKRKPTPEALAVWARATFPGLVELPEEADRFPVEPDRDPKRARATD